MLIDPPLQAQLRRAKCDIAQIPVISQSSLADTALPIHSTTGNYRTTQVAYSTTLFLRICPRQQNIITCAETSPLDLPETYQVSSEEHSADSCDLQSEQNRTNRIS